MKKNELVCKLFGHFQPLKEFHFSLGILQPKNGWWQCQRCGCIFARRIDE
jgi:hypothetical protein